MSKDRETDFFLSFVDEDTTDFTFSALSYNDKNLVLNKMFDFLLRNCYENSYFLSVANLEEKIVLTTKEGFKALVENEAENIVELMVDETKEEFENKIYELNYIRDDLLEKINILVEEQANFYIMGYEEGVQETEKRFEDLGFI